MQSSFNSIKVDKGSLLDSLETNYATYKELYEFQVSEYFLKSEQLLKEALKRIKNKDSKVTTVILNFPKDYSSEYEKIIGMLKMSMDNEIILSHDDYDVYVLNNWYWKQAFKNNFVEFGTYSSSNKNDRIYTTSIEKINNF